MFMINVKGNLKESMIILRKTYVLEAGICGMKKVKSLPKILLNLENFHGAQSQISISNSYL